MAQKNIVLKGTTYNGVESITLPVSGGGDATFVETSDADAVAADIAQNKTAYVNGSKITGTASGGGNWTWMGENPTKVQTYVEEKVYLKDSAYATWTPSTTATAATTSGALTAYTTNYSNYDYIIFYRFHTHFEYSTITNARIDDWYYVRVFNTYGISSNLTNMTSGTINSATYENMTAKIGMFYTNTSGVDSYTTQTSYGVYVNSISAPSVTSSSIIPYSTAISMRCNNTYFSITSADAVNQNTSYYEQTVELWRVNKGTSLGGGSNDTIRDMWLNGF